MGGILRVGHIGAGWMGMELLEKLIEHPDVELAGLFEPCRENLDAALGRFGIPAGAAAGSYEELLERAPDAIVIASPNEFHARHSIPALERGIHVFCEKPAASDYADALRQKELDDEHPETVTMVDYILRLDDMSQRIHGMMEQQAFGRITQIQINYRHAVNIAGRKIWKTETEPVGMGPVHSIDSILWHMAPDRVRSVFATAMGPMSDAFRTRPIYTILIHFESGATGIVNGDIETANGYDAHHSIFGTEGWFVFDSQAYADPADPQRSHKVRLKSRKLTGGEWLYPMNRDMTPEEKLWPRDMSFPDSGDCIHHKTRESVGHFIECVQKKQKSPFGFSNSFSTCEVVFAARVSAETGEPVALPLDRKMVKKILG